MYMVMIEFSGILGPTNTTNTKLLLKVMPLFDSSVQKSTRSVPVYPSELVSREVTATDRSVGGKNRRQ